MRKAGAIALFALMALLTLCAMAGCKRMSAATPAPRLATTPSRTAGWPQWDDHGRGRLVGTQEQGGAGVPGYDDGVAITSHTATDGLDVWQALTVAATTQTRFTILGRPSASFRRAEDTPDGTITVDFVKRGNALVARSIDASPSGTDLIDQLMSNRLAAAQNNPVSAAPLPSRIASSEMARARAQYRAHPGAWLFVDRDGTGYVAGVVNGWSVYLGSTPGILSFYNVSHAENASGVSLRTGIHVLVDRHSVYETGGRFRSAIDATAFPPSMDTGDSAPECLFAVRRVGASLVMREAVALPAQ